MLRLSIITCTINLDALLQSKLLTLVRQFIQENAAETTPFIIVNQGQRSKSAFSSTEVIFEQGNHGGAGGFTRGIIEAAKIDATHFILIDDDAIPDINSFYITANYYKQNSGKMVALHGAMFSLENPDVIYEAGAWNKQPENKKFDIVRRLANYIPQKDITHDPVLCENYDIDYGAWWFLALPISAIEMVGLPLPLFIRGDDREYGMRLKRAGIPTLPLPGLRVWHPEHGDKLARWYFFFNWRNNLVIKSLFVESSAFFFSIEIFKKIFYRAISHQYDAALLIIAGVKSYLLGPDTLINENAKHLILAKQIEQKGFHGYIAAEDNEFTKYFHANPKPLTLIREIIWTLLLNAPWQNRYKGTLFPYFTPKEFTWLSACGVKQYGLYSQGEKRLKVYCRNIKTLVLILNSSVLLFFKLNAKYARCAAEWKQKHISLTKRGSWNQLFTAQK